MTPDLVINVMSGNRPKASGKTDLEPIRGS
jgi:hypothetical protein